MKIAMIGQKGVPSRSGGVEIHVEEIAARLRASREKAGYKQSELAEMVGARRETIVHLENGRYNPSLKLAMDIAKIFNVTVEELFEFVDNEK